MMIPYCILAIEDDADRAFMGGLYREYHRLMYTEIVQIVKRAWDAEDVMQITLEKLIDKILLLRSLEEKPRVNYIVSACKNTSYNYLRARGRGNEILYEDYLEADEGKYDGHEMEFRMIREEELGCLTRIWPKLDERTRHILEGYYILEKPMSELGKELGIKADSMRMTLVRARKKAYELLEKELEESR